MNCGCWMSPRPAMHYLEPVEDQVNTANVRHYDLNGSTLTLTVVGDDGKPTAVSSWEEAELTSIVDSYSRWQVAVITDTLQSITSL